MIKEVIEIIPTKTNLSYIKTKKKVGAYCRVSTKSEQQQPSLIIQEEFYKDYINKNAEWEFVGIYADNGISATNTLRRKQFNKMIEDCLAGYINIILTKSISRFARNLLDLLATIKILKELNVTIIFEKENINTSDKNSEFIISILASIAEEESRSISYNVRWAMQKKFQAGKVVLNTNKMLGYEKNEKGELKIVEEEIEIVKLIFDLYLKGYSLQKVADYLNGKNIKTVLKNKWTAESIKYILQNEKYTGDLLLGKSKIDMMTKKRIKNNSTNKQYFVRDNHCPIISRDIFEKVQQEFKYRNTLRNYTPSGNGRHSNLSVFSNKLYCGCCSSSLIHVKVRSKNNTDKWYCPKHLYNKNLCDLKAVREDFIKSAFIKLINLENIKKSYENLNLNCIEDIFNNLIDSVIVLNQLKYKFKLKNNTEYIMYT